MKEKIKEIATQAKIQMVSEPRLQEFADLIISECIDSMRKINKNHARTTYDIDLVEATIARCIDNIKASFE
jgi:hypothetical protein